MSPTQRIICSIGAGVLTCSAQGIAVGAVGGVRATDDLTSGAAYSVSPRYVAGPQVDIGLPFGFGIEADALYRREGYQASAFYSGEFDSHANSWEFALLLKYRIPSPLVKPFIEAGYATRVISGTVHYNTNGTTDGTDYPTSQGVVVAGGVQIGIGRLRLSPEIRYTHWNNTPIVIYFGNGPTSLSTQNQMDVLLGVAWKLR